jgi:hypothetical protein
MKNEEAGKSRPLMMGKRIKSDFQKVFMAFIGNDHGFREQGLEDGIAVCSIESNDQGHDSKGGVILGF